uniref:Spermatogenesis associated 9 n=1 Tax=Rousettus aegyptiacus TaxID=9407 RepID=A0A7J8F571_ROUAE|nr:spermatogenesis associated 9 [Rousettus aegyptiacus]
MDLVDEFKDEFPTILRLSQSNQNKNFRGSTNDVWKSFVLILGFLNMKVRL